MNENIENTNLYTTEYTISKDNPFNTFTRCLVCGESIEISMWENHIQICPACKKAIMHIRKELELCHVSDEVIN